MRFAIFVFFTLLIGISIVCCNFGQQSNASGSNSLQNETRKWLAGDHHVHSRNSINTYENEFAPLPVARTDADYAITVNALKARDYGLAWMVSTDHGGYNHSEYNLKNAYPELKRSRAIIPEVLQFYGMEFNVPGAEHGSLIIPHVPGEDSILYNLEHTFDERNTYPRDESRDTEEKMLEALTYMKSLPNPPVLFINHPSRSAEGFREYGANTPAELRNWAKTAPNVVVGMEGAPGHQGRLNKNGTIDPGGDRGGYDDFPTMGGFDQMTAIVGGMWDALLSEGYKWFITSTSDSHHNWRYGGGDFWPGEYSKTYVYASKEHDDILDGLRTGRMFVVLGDLISEVFVTARSTGNEDAAGIGETLSVKSGSDFTITIKVKDPENQNYHGDNPELKRVDLIAGKISGPADDPTKDSTRTTSVVKRFTKDTWREENGYIIMNFKLTGVKEEYYVRVRGTSNLDELEPEADPLGENPWNDLWFYTNPVFISVEY